MVYVGICIGLGASFLYVLRLAIATGRNAFIAATAGGILAILGILLLFFLYYLIEQIMVFPD
jgi:hypothetical protein